MSWYPRRSRPEEMVGMKIAMLFTSSIAMMALFSTLNVTFLVYGLQMKHPMNSLVKEGTSIAPFSLETLAKSLLSSEQLDDYCGVVLHFVSVNCPYCEGQIPKLDAIAQQFQRDKFRFITVSQHVLSDFQALGPHLEWAEDQRGTFSDALGINGFPTMILLDSKGTVVKTISGASTSFDEELTKQLTMLATS